MIRNGLTAVAVAQDVAYVFSHKERLAVDGDGTGELLAPEAVFISSIVLTGRRNSLWYPP